MANCSFIKATDARTRARNDTLIWTEICEVQAAILAAIDANQYSTTVDGGTPFTTTQEITNATLVNGGSGFSIEAATAVIDPNGTGGKGAEITPTVTGSAITSFDFIDGNTGDLVLKSVIVVTPGAGYTIGELLTMDITGGTLRVGGDGDAVVAVSAVSTIDTQDELNFDGAGTNGTWVGGDGAGGTAYVPTDTIELTDGSTITVDAVDVDGDVTQFTVTTSSESPGIPTQNATLAQLSTIGAGNGEGFSLTLGNANQEVYAVDIIQSGQYTVAPSNPNTPTTNGAGAGVTLTGTYGYSYTPVSATAVVQNTSELITGQTDADFPGNTHSDGTNYMVGEVLTLSENSLVTVGSITASGNVLIAKQTQADYLGPLPNGSFVGGDGVGGTVHEIGDVITMSDGATVTVVNVDVDGDVTEFEVTTSSTSATALSEIQRTQFTTTGTGAGFALSPSTNNEQSVGTINAFTVTSTGVTPFFLGQTLTVASSDTTAIAPSGQVSIGTGFTLTPTTSNAVTIGHSGATAVLAPIHVDGIIDRVAVNSTGSGYLVGQPVTIIHPNGSGATAAVSTVNGSGGITTVVVTNGGTGYEPANALVTVTHPTGQDFAGTVQVNANGQITGISIQNGGTLYGNIFPYVTIVDNAGTGGGAEINITGVSEAGAISSIQLADGGSGYGDPVANIYTTSDVLNTTASITLTTEANTFGTDPLDYYAVLSGQATDVVIADQIQYVLDYFTALGYNIRAQVNPATANTLQWQIIW